MIAFLIAEGVLSLRIHCQLQVVYINYYVDKSSVPKYIKMVKKEEFINVIKNKVDKL